MKGEVWHSRAVKESALQKNPHTMHICFGTSKDIYMLITIYSSYGLRKVVLLEKAASFLVLSKSFYLIFGSEKSPLWCSWKENTAANNKPSQSITTNTNRAQSESTQLTALQCKVPPASPPRVKQQHPDAWINVATNNCNVSDCERCHALPDALLRRNGMLM